MKIRRRYCPKCKRSGPASKDVPAHVLHFFLTLFTFGFWLLPWVLFTVSGKYACNACGAKTFGSKTDMLVHRTVMVAAILAGVIVATIVVVATT